MDRKPLRIVIIGDSRNQSIAETHLKLVKQTSFGGSLFTKAGFDLLHPEKTAKVLNTQSIALVHIGTPGLKDYPKQLHSFLDAYAAVQHMPAVGVVTHDPEHTRYVAGQWFNGPSRSPHDLPDGALSIVDASRPLLPKTVERALQILSGNIPSLSKSVQHAIPLNKVAVDDVITGQKETLVHA